MTGYAKYKKLPAAKFGVMISGLLFLLGGAYIIAGFWVDLGALFLAVTLILAAFIFHNFWKETDATAKMNEQIAFNKDLSLAGASLILFALVASGTLTDFGPSVGTFSFFGQLSKSSANALQETGGRFTFPATITLWNP